jgi:hypothetical protein
MASVLPAAPAAATLKFTEKLRTGALKSLYYEYLAQYAPDEQQQPSRKRSLPVGKSALSMAALPVLVSSLRHTQLLTIVDERVQLGLVEKWFNALMRMMAHEAALHSEAYALFTESVLLCSLSFVTQHHADWLAKLFDALSVCTTHTHTLSLSLSVSLSLLCSLSHSLVIWC